MGFARRRELTVTADGANNQTGWNSLKYGGIACITAPGVMTANVTLQRRDSAGNISDVTDAAGNAVVYTKVGTYLIDPNLVRGEYRLNCKAGGFTAGPFTMAIEAD